MGSNNRAQGRRWRTLGIEARTRNQPQRGCTGADLNSVADLGRLEELILSASRVTDAGLARLEGLTQLQQLPLGGTKITDGGLAHLKGLKGLEMLGLRDTPVTNAGTEELHQSLPNSRIRR